MKKNMIFVVILAGGLMGGNMFAIDAAMQSSIAADSKIDPMAAFSALGPVFKDVENVKKSYADAVTAMNEGGKAFNAAKNKAEKARGAIKMINNGLDPLSKLIALFTSLSNAIVALNLSSKISDPVKAQILPNLIKATETIKQMINTMDLLTMLIPEEKPVAVEEIALEEAIFE